ncbi:Phage tail tube protein [Raoultella terrigena]|uniref:Phage tail tube protein n=1 Tax=Raoultella terrigena TaxID=577 RepID=A0A4U9DCX8_RAOTE|nr:Phage tail tube protein [Raoultella terrigena]
MVEGSFKYQPSTVNRSTLTVWMVCMVIRKNRLPGISQHALRDSGGTSVRGFNGQTNVNVIAELANGKTIIGRALWTVNGSGSGKRRCRV